MAFQDRYRVLVVTTTMLTPTLKIISVVHLHVTMMDSALVLTIDKGHFTDQLIRICHVFHVSDMEDMKVTEGHMEVIQLLVDTVDTPGMVEGILDMAEDTLAMGEDSLLLVDILVPVSTIRT